MSSSVLVTGASGSLGRVLARSLGASGWRVTGWHHRHPLHMAEVATHAVNLEDAASIRDAVRHAAPRAIVHAAAATNVDWCEENRQATRCVNVEATRLLAEEAAAAGAHFIYVSTDLVFDGTGAPYGEEDEPNPRSVYGRSKHDGEMAALGVCPSAAILRVALLYGWGSPQQGTFFDFLIHKLEGGEAVGLLTDQFRTPALLEDVAVVVENVLRRGSGGVFHVGGAERVNRMEFGRAACRVFALPESLLRPARTADFTFRAPRPADVSLRTDRMRSELGVTPRTVSEGMERLRAERAARGGRG